MKKIIFFIIMFETLLFSNSFKKETEYVCLNTYNIQSGQKNEVKREDSIKKPLIITLKKDKLYTNSNAEFDFKMQKGSMVSYSNQDLMLLLNEGLVLGLVPKKARGQLRFFFKCKQN